MIGHTSKRRGRSSRAAIVIIFFLVATLTTPLSPARLAAQGIERAEAVVLVNRTSARFGDFDQLVEPYFNHFGLPYTVLYIDAAEVTASIGDYALIVVGHRELDISGSYLSPTEEDNILNAVMAGSGLVNLDGDVTDGINGRYDFVNSIFGFGYKAPVVDYGVLFPIESGTRGTVIECTADANQNPDPTVSTINLTDGQWTEMDYPPRPEPALIAGLDETVPIMECFASGLANGEYQVFADLYTGVFGDDMIYYYGYSPGTPTRFSVDTVGRSGGEDRFGEYRLEPVNITNGEFHIYFNAADARTIPAASGGRAMTSELYADNQNMSVAAPTYFGWSSIRLVPVGTPPPAMHWITTLHDPGEWIGTGNLPMSGIDTMSMNAVVVAQSRTEPLVVAATAGQGRAVHWASYDWMSYDIKGPMYDLDDLVWRSLVWAARKPFAIQGLPPFVTMRVDDSTGPFDWIDTVNAYGFKPWAGLFYQEIADDAAAKLATLVNAGNASASVHAKDRNVETTGDFYYDHGIGDLPDTDVQDNFAHAKGWFDAHGIPIAKFVVPQFYELGTNVFDELNAWGVEFVATVIEPGTGWQSPWIKNGPFRLYQDGASDSGHPLYYADSLTYDPRFFNCITEIRDDAGYEWFPNNDVAGSVGRGTRQLERALDAMAVATLFTHEAEIDAIDPANLDAIGQGISDNLAHYGIMGVTMDHACQYARAMLTSDIDTAEYDPVGQRLTVSLVGNTDMQTWFYLFTDNEGTIEQRMVDVPQFAGSRDVQVNLAPPSFVFLPVVVKGP